MGGEHTYALNPNTLKHTYVINGPFLGLVVVFVSFARDVLQIALPKLVLRVCTQHLLGD